MCIRDSVSIALSKNPFEYKQIHGTFLQLLNDGNSTAENVEIHDSRGNVISVGSLPTTVTKFVLLDYTVRNPYREELSVMPAKISFEYEIQGDRKRREIEYTELSKKSWTPSLITDRGVGSAIFGERNSHLLKD